MKTLIALLCLLSSINAFADSFFTPTTAPVNTYAVNPANTQQQIGAKFSASAPGFVYGLRWWKTTGETGNHAVALLSTAGALLASNSLTEGETASGWQVAMFTTPYLIAADTDYYIVRHSNGQSLSYTANVAAIDINNMHLYAGSFYQNTTSTTTFVPNANASGYFVDVMYVPKSRTFILIPNDQ